MVAMALAASTCVWRPWLVMKNAIFRAVQPVLGQMVYICYDYVHLDNLLDISACRTVVKPKLRKSLYVYDSVVTSILTRTFKIRKV